MFFRIQSKPRICEVFFGIPTEVDGKIKKVDGTLEFMAKYGFHPLGKDEGVTISSAWRIGTIGKMSRWRMTVSRSTTIS